MLAAGRGTRLGGPKALLAWPWEGREVPLAAAHAFARTESDGVWVVTRADIAAALRRHAPEMGIVVSEEDDALGPSGSLRAASEVVPEGALVVITPVDCPPVARAIVQRLLDALQADPAALAARPRHGGRRGHPVVVRSEIVLGYRDQARPLRDVLADLGPRALEVEVETSAVLADLNRPDDLGGRPRFFGLDSAEPADETGRPRT